MRVVVVGAGIIGLLTAWRLQRRGVHTTVVDPTPGQGATHAAGGMLAAISEVAYSQQSLYPLMRASAAEYPTLIEQLGADTARPLGYEPVGTVVVAADQADRDTLALLAEVQRALGLSVQEITARQASRLEPALTSRLAGAFHTPDDHRLDPRLFTAALLDAVGQSAAGRVGRGAIETTPVVGVVGLVGEAPVSGVRLADGRTVTADRVVLATGLGLDQQAGQGGLGLAGAPPLPLRPVHGDVLKVRVPAKLLLPGETHLLTETVRAIVHGVPVYLIPRSDRTLVIGATSREDDLPGPSAGGVFRLLRDAGTVVPAVWDTELIETVSRARPGSPDDIPLLGEVADGLIVSNGYFRHGILLAALGSRLTADLVLGEVRPDDREHLATMDPSRFARADNSAVSDQRSASPERQEVR